MRSTRSVRGILLAMLVAWSGISLLAVAVASAAPIAVTDGGEQIGSIDFANYGVKYSYFDPDRDGPGMGGRVTHDPPRRTPPLTLLDDSGGARFDANFTFTGCPPGEKLRPGTQFRWLQIVYTNAPQTNAVRGNAPTTGYVDPWSPPAGGNGVGGTGYEDLKPFYWTDAELADANIGGNPNPASPPTTLKFNDTSQRPFTAANANEVTWKAYLNLVCTWDQMIHVLGYYEWGWKMPMGMAGDFAKVISLDPAVPTWTAGASPGLNGILTSATEFGPGYAGDANRPGWTLTNQTCCIPEPAMATMIVMATIGAWIATGRQRRTAA